MLVNETVIGQLNNPILSLILQERNINSTKVIKEDNIYLTDNQFTVRCDVCMNNHILDMYMNEGDRTLFHCSKCEFNFCDKAPCNNGIELCEFCQCFYCESCMSDSIKCSNCDQKLCSYLCQKAKNEMYKTCKFCDSAICIICYKEDYEESCPECWRKLCSDCDNRSLILCCYGHDCEMIMCSICEDGMFEKCEDCNEYYYLECIDEHNISRCLKCNSPLKGWVAPEGWIPFE